MPCYHPLECWYKDGGGITFRASEALYGLAPRFVSCGQCMGCRLERSRQWAVRCMHEASLHRSNCFVTLTYNDQSLDHLPRSVVDFETGELGDERGLTVRDVQLFFKSMRKAGIKFRYLQCGEYGEKSSRPHHHVLFFGYDPPDRKFHSRRNGFNYYTSEILQSFWPHGFVIVGDLTFESAAYVARYCLKKFTGKGSDFVYRGLRPEFITMSLKPGIAHDWIVNNMSDVYPNDRVYVRPGVTARPPKYYDKIFDRLTEDFADVRRIRILKAMARPREPLRRLVDREICHELRAKQLIRNLD